MRTRVAIGQRPDQWLGQTRVESWELAYDACKALEAEPPKGYRIELTSQRRAPKGARAFIRVVLQKTDSRVPAIDRDDVRAWIDEAIGGAGGITE